MRISAGCHGTSDSLRRQTCPLAVNFSKLIAELRLTALYKLVILRAQIAGAAAHHTVSHEGWLIEHLGALAYDPVILLTLAPVLSIWHAACSSEARLGATARGEINLTRGA